ncbi:MAG: hypothetical protein QM726_16635 [Chitinophagaceae bacterium]
MKKRFFPTNIPATKLWASNIVGSLPAIVGKLGDSQSEAAVVIAALQDLNSKIDETNQANEAAKKAMATRDHALDTCRRMMTKYANRIKSNPNYTDDIGEQLQIVDKPGTIEDLADFKPVIQVKVSGGRPEIRFKKRKVHAIAIYSRINAGAWTLIGVATVSAFIDKRLPLVANTVQENEYYGVGMINNNEVGQRSEIVSCSYKG